MPTAKFGEETLLQDPEIRFAVNSSCLSQPSVLILQYTSKDALVGGTTTPIDESDTESGAERQFLFLRFPPILIGFPWLETINGGLFDLSCHQSRIVTRGV